MRPAIDESETLTHAADRAFVPGPVLLLGAPGVGKGTQAKVLMAEFGIPQISTGDLLRDHRARHTDLGIKADALMSQGQLVPDDLVNEMVRVRLSQTDCERGYILDGFPRTLAQADWLDAFIGANKALPVVAIAVIVPHDDLLRRITGRRICPDGHIYNIHSQAPQLAGICDIDGMPLSQRKDDSEEVFEHRMTVFYQETAQVIDHYRTLGRFTEIDGRQSIELVSDAIREALHRLRAERG